MIADGTDVTTKVEAAFKRGVVHSILTTLETDASSIEQKILTAFHLGAASKD